MKKSEFVLIAARHPDGLSACVGYLPGAKKPYILILNNQALREYKTKSGASRALLALSELFGIDLSGSLYTRTDGDEWIAEKTVILQYKTPISCATAKVF